MTDTRPGLVLHIAGVDQPVHIALDPAQAESLGPDLAVMMAAGEARALTTADGGQVTVNFAHVATAHIEAARSDNNAYGAPARSTGFGS